MMRVASTTPRKPAYWRTVSFGFTGTPASNENVPRSANAVVHEKVTGRPVRATDVFAENESTSGRPITRIGRYAIVTPRSLAARNDNDTSRSGEKRKSP